MGKYHLHDMLLLFFLSHYAVDFVLRIYKGVITCNTTAEVALWFVLRAGLKSLCLILGCLHLDYTFGTITLEN